MMAKLIHLMLDQLSFGKLIMEALRDGYQPIIVIVYARIVEIQPQTNGELGFGYRPQLSQYISAGGDLTQEMLKEIEESRLMGLLLYYQIAGLYASSADYKGLTGVAAGELFLHDAAWDLHLCMIGQ